MESPMIQLIVLAAIALFLILRLKSVLGTRDGFEAPRRVEQPEPTHAGQQFDVIEPDTDHDIADHADEGSEAAAALTSMKQVEPDFSVSEFLQGARGAYEMILMSFERGEIDQISDFLGPEVRETLEQVVKTRHDNGVSVEAEFLGVHHVSLAGAHYNETTRFAEITVNFVGELTSVVKNQAGEIIEGTPGQSKRQKDTWTFERMMGSEDPNWRLVATE